MSVFNMTTRNDARQICAGVSEYHWGDGGANFDDLCDYVWAHHNDEKYDAINNRECFDADDDRQAASDLFSELFRDYLLSIDENPADWAH